MHQGLSLYRAILRQHRMKLPAHLRKLGDDYVKAEFREHRQAKPEFLESFYFEWNRYLANLKAQSLKFGAYLTDEELRSLSAEQRQQLSKLREEAAKAAKGEQGEEDGERSQAGR